MRRSKGLSFYQREKKISKELMRTIATFVYFGMAMVFLAFVFVFCFGIRTSVIGISMEPTLSNGQEILIDRFTYFVVSPKAGDVVVFLPNGNENSHYYVKRIIGEPGDSVLIQNGLIYVNGVLYEDEEVFDKIEDGGIATNGITLGDGEYFVLGDNRNNSEDSRSSNVGIVLDNYIIGRVWFHLKDANGTIGFVK